MEKLIGNDLQYESWAEYADHSLSHDDVVWDTSLHKHVFVQRNEGGEEDDKGRQEVPRARSD